MSTVPGEMDRSAMPSGEFTSNIEMAKQISESAVFSSIANEVRHQRTVQAMKWNYSYVLNDDIDGQVTQAFFITIEQGTDFQCKWLTASAYSYEDDQGDPTLFPIPNSLAAVNWAGRGLSLRVTDMRSGRELTSGFAAFELFGTPGYGLNFQHPYPFNYFFMRNSQIRFDVRNRDSALRNHQFAILLNGYKIATPN